MQSRTACASWRSSSPGDEVARHDAAGLSVGHDQVEHLAAREQRDRARVDLPQHRLVGTEQELLACLSARVKRTRHLRTAEGSIVEQPAVFARKRHARRHALVDDVDAELREPVHVRFARAIVAALYRVVEEAVDAIAVIPIILGGVDAPLRGDAVRAARAVEDAEQFDAVALLAERRGRGRSRQPGADDDDFVLAPVRRVDQLVFEFPPFPLAVEGAAWNLRIQRHDRPPTRNTQRVMTMKPPAITTADTLPIFRMSGVKRGPFKPTD